MAKKRKNNVYHKPVANPGGGSVFYDKRTDRWVGVVRALYNPKVSYDTAVNIYVSAETPSEAMEKLEKAKMEKAFLYFLDPDTVTFRELFTSMVKENYEKRVYQLQTFSAEMSRLGRISEIADYRMKDITSQMIVEMLMKKVDNYSTSVLRDMYLDMRNCFDLGISLNIINENPVRRLSRPISNKPTRHIRELTVDEETRLTKLLLEHKPTHWEIYLLSLYTGMQFGEITALTGKDIRLDEGYININKKVIRVQNKAELNTEHLPDSFIRKLYISETVRPLLEYIISHHTRGDDGLLFRSKCRRHLTPGAVGSAFARLIQKYDFIDSGIPGIISGKSLRKTYIKRSIEAGVQMKVLQKNLAIIKSENLSIAYNEVGMAEKADETESVNNYLNELGLNI